LARADCGAAIHCNRSQQLAIGADTVSGLGPASHKTPRSWTPTRTSAVDVSGPFSAFGAGPIRPAYVAEEQLSYD